MNLLIAFPVGSEPIHFLQRQNSIVFRGEVLLPFKGVTKVGTTYWCSFGEDANKRYLLSHLYQMDMDTVQYLDGKLHLYRTSVSAIEPSTGEVIGGLVFAYASIHPVRHNSKLVTRVGRRNIYQLNV